MIEQFISKIRQATGFSPDPAKIIPGGEMVRFATSDRRGDESGWCRLFSDGEGGVFGCFRQGLSESWQARQPANPEQRAAFQEKVKQARQEAAKIEEQQRAECRKKSAELWELGREVDAKHGYILAKQIKPYGAKQLQGSLIVPVRDAAGTLHGLQFIQADGSKRFKSGTTVAGCYHSIGKPNGKLLVAEGFATAATLHESTGLAVACAFNAGNLKPVAESLRAKYPTMTIIVAADDDHATDGNPGLSKATEAARAVNGLLARPAFPETRGPKDTDFNDLARLAGLAAVKSCIDGAASPEPCTSIETAPQVTAECDISDAWLEPEPLPEGLPPVMALAPEMIPEPLRDWLMDISERMQAPPDYAAAAAVVALGSVIGRGCGIYPKRRDDWLVIPNVYGGIVGRPSLLKTPSVTEAQRPLTRLEAEERELFNSALAGQNMQQEVDKITRAALAEELKRAVKSNDTAKIEAAQNRLAALAEDKPITRRRYQTQDGTTEKIGEILVENPRGILVNRDELVGWFRGLDKPGRESDRAFFLEAWNGTRGFTYDRIGRGTLDIPALCLSVFGCLTPGGLSEYVHQCTKGGAGDDGLLQRFQVLVWPDAVTEWRNVDRYPDSTARARAWEIFSRLSGEIPGTDKTGEIPALRFTTGASGTFDTWRAELETRLRGEHGLTPALESHLAKYRSLMPTLALIFHLVEVADGTASGDVSEQAALMAAAWCEYLESHAGRIYGGAVAPGMEQAREIVKHIRRGAIQDGSTARDVLRHHWAKLSTIEDVRAGISMLSDYGWLLIEKTDTGGRPSEKIRFNPRANI